MKEVYVIVAVSLFCQIVKCQDFFSLISPFFGRVVVPKEEKTGNGGSLVQEFVKLGTNIGQRLLQVKNSHSKSQSFQALIPKLQESIPQIATIPPKFAAVKERTPLSMSSRGNYDVIAEEFHGTARASPPPLNHFPTNNVSHTIGILQNQLYLGQRQQQTFQFHRSPQPQQQLVARFQAAHPTSNDAIKDSISFGQEVTRLLGEIAQYSDVHRFQNQDYASVQKLLNIFFNSMSSGQNDNHHTMSFQQWLRPMNDGTEIGRNRPIAKNLFESDIVLTVDQIKGIAMARKQQRTGNFRRRNRRKVITGRVYRWPKDNNIPYEFASSDALYFWQRETCVRWQENGPGYDRVVFFRGSGCYSNVGRTGGRQEISIGYGCEDLGIVTHEIGHSLGFWHEQSRPDRDQYIKLQNKYIARGTEGNFVKRSYMEIENMGVPFDLGSVMHYGPNAFSVDWNHTTIETIDKRYSHTIGQRYGPSFTDVKQMNRLYCNHVCGASPLTCENGGYLDPNNCQSCKCPTGLGGPTCTDLQPSICGAELIATSSWQQLSYKGSQKCYWRIKANNARIRIKIESANFRCDITCRAYVEIKHNSVFEQTGFRMWFLLRTYLKNKKLLLACGNDEVNVLSEQAEALVIFDATEISQEGSFILYYVQDSGKPLAKPSPLKWIPGSEDRLFRGLEVGKNGVIEKFILNAIPKIRDAQQPAASIASIVTDFALKKILG
uniref:Metalloendopeptidase n=1 Tax=Wuchereria bancrofti TaxID=6293 RepID=A0A1I8ENT0_WUCBA